MPDTRMDFAKKLLADDPNLSDDDLSAALKIHDAHAQAGPEKTRTWLDTAKDVGTGVVKGAAASVAGLGAAAGHIPDVFNPAGGNLRQAVDTLYGRPGLSGKAFQAADEMTALPADGPSRTPQMVGKGLETAAEFALPGPKVASAVADAIPTVAKAGAKFQSVMGAARHIPVNIEAPGQVALRISQLAERGGSMPMAVNKFLRRVTDPEKAPMAYEEARDFASNISRLSANEFQRLTPAVAREVAGLRVTLNKAVAEAAGKAGKGAEYAQAMNEYAKAMRVKNAVNEVVTGVKRVAPYATAAGAGTWLTTKLMGLLRDE